jgi:signal transduction histidine kinase
LIINSFPGVIEILLSNAIEYSDDGGKITIFFDHSEIKTDSGMIEVIRVHFADEGVGIPDDELSYIFDKFFQSTRTKTGAGGKGLGLAICKEIMHSHKGKIGAEHNPKGKGSVFILELPRKAGHYNI